MEHREEVSLVYYPTNFSNYSLILIDNDDGFL